MFSVSAWLLYYLKSEHCEETEKQNETYNSFRFPNAVCRFQVLFEEPAGIYLEMYTQFVTAF